MKEIPEGENSMVADASFFKMYVNIAAKSESEDDSKVVTAFLKHLYDKFDLLSDQLSPEEKEKFDVVSKRVCTILVGEFQTQVQSLGAMMENSHFETYLIAAQQKLSKIDELEKYGYFSEEQKQEVENSRRILNSLETEVPH